MTLRSLSKSGQLTGQLFGEMPGDDFNVGTANAAKKAASLKLTVPRRLLRWKYYQSKNCLVVVDCSVLRRTLCGVDGAE